MVQRGAWPVASVVLFRPPAADEAAALAVAARYLSHAGSAASTHLLGRQLDAGDLTLPEAVRDSLLAGAALCAGLLNADTNAPGSD